MRVREGGSVNQSLGTSTPSLLRTARGVQGQVHREHAADAREILNAQDASIRFDALARNGQPQAKPRRLVRALGERLEHAFGVARPQPSTPVLDFDQ